MYLGLEWHVGSCGAHACACAQPALPHPRSCMPPRLPRSGPPPCWGTQGLRVFAPACSAARPPLPPKQPAQGSCPQPMTASPACSVVEPVGAHALPLHALPCGVPPGAASGPGPHAAFASGMLQPCAAVCIRTYISAKKKKNVRSARTWSKIARYGDHGNEALLEACFKVQS